MLYANLKLVKSIYMFEKLFVLIKKPLFAEVKKINLND